MPEVEEKPPKPISKPREWIEHQLEQNREHLSKARIAVAILIIFAGWVGFTIEGILDEKVLKAKDSTIETLTTGAKERNDRIERLEKDLSKAKGTLARSYPQVLTYTKDPNVEKLIPEAINLPALAYGGDGSFCLWNTNSQKWEWMMK